MHYSTLDPLTVSLQWLTGMMWIWSVDPWICCVTVAWTNHMCRATSLRFLMIVHVTIAWRIDFHLTTSQKVPVSPHNHYVSWHFITRLTPPDNLPNTSWSTTCIYLTFTCHCTPSLSPQTLSLPPSSLPHAPHTAHHLPSPTTTPILSLHPLHITAHSLSLSGSPVTYLTPLNESTEVKPQTEWSNTCTAATLEHRQLWLNMASQL